MDINNVTQFYTMLARVGLVDVIPNGRSLMACVDEYNYNCNCEKQTNRKAVYNRCNAIYEEMIRGMNNSTITLLFQKIPDMSISFRKEGNQHLRTIVR